MKYAVIIADLNSGGIGRVISNHRTERAGFNLPDDMDNDEIAKIVGAILEALNIEWVN